MTGNGKRRRSHALNYEHATGSPSTMVLRNRRRIPDVESNFCSSVKSYYVFVQKTSCYVQKNIPGS